MEQKKRTSMRRYIVAKKNLNKFKKIEMDDLEFKRLKNNKNALEAEHVDTLLGRKIKRNLFKDATITFLNSYGKKKH